jgi:predicted anti-sigma-YlaC factor YlaD
LITIADAGIFGLGDNQVLLRVEFGGDARGYVYLIGKPEINTMTQAVYLSGLRYDPGTTHLLQTTAPDWFNDALLRESIAPEVVLGVTPMIDRIRDSLRSGLNRTLTPTVSMQGTVTSMQGIAVFADVDALHVRAMSEGTLTVTVDSKP